MATKETAPRVASPPATPAKEDSFDEKDEKETAPRVAPPPATPTKEDSFDEKDEKDLSYDDDNKDIKVETIEAVFAEVRAIDLGEDGKERPIETSDDYALRLISLEDNPELPIWSFRMIFLSLGLSCFGAVLGQIFYFRPQTIYVSQLFLLIIAYLMGKGMEHVIPGPGATARFRTRDNAFWRFMNPGEFNIKEHVAITIMSSTAGDAALAISIIAAQSLYYNVTPNAAVGIFTLISSQLVGYGLAGFMRSFLVFPTFAVYPHIIPQVQLFDALHRGQGFLLQKKRLTIFWSVFVGIFVWEWFPEYIAPLLTGISVFCLANQKSQWFTRVFGGASGNEGLGAFSLCLDWGYVGSGGSSIGSLFTPLSTQLSLYFGCAICMITFSACYAMDIWHAQSFPFLSQLLFYRNGTPYNQLLILNDDFTLNYDKLAEQGLPWYAASQLIYKVSRTLYMGAAIMHFILWHSKTVYKIIRDSRKEECQDVHYQKMKVYKEVSVWVYVAIYVVSSAIALGTIYGAKSGLPWWGLIVSLLCSFFFAPIIIFVQMVGGALIPGKPVANMYFSLYGYNSVLQSYALTRDLKLGQYTKLPPRTTLAVQMIGSIVGGLLNFVIANTVLTSRREILLDNQGTNVWSGQQVQSYNSAAIAWGALGKPLYATGGIYGFVPYMIIAGLGFPIPFWLLHRKYPKFGWNNVFTPILVAELGYLSVGINSSIFTSFLLAVFSQYYLRKYRPTFFRKYNFLLSAALDGGTNVMIFVYTFAVGGGSGTVVDFPTWALNPSLKTKNLDYCVRIPTNS